jgi:transcriptional regulator GlxA family with amidase domain
MTRSVAVLVYPDFQLLDAAGPIAAFEIAGRIVAGSYEAAEGSEARAGAPAAYGIAVVGPAPGPVTSSSGVALLARGLPRRSPDTLMVVGGRGDRRAAADPRLVARVRALAAGARRVTSVCSGAYLLAEAGLLDGRRATTHWVRCADFARRYPDVTLDPDRIFVRDGKIWTSAGITAGIDLALALIGEDLGEDVARQTAQALVVYHRRPGGQSQFSSLVEMEGQGGRFAELLDWSRQRLAEPLTVERLADHQAMSPRHFARAFRAETGVTPAKAIERLRLEVARERVERGTGPIDLVARGVGFGDPERMRRAFVRAFGQPPQALRRAARVQN